MITKRTITVKFAVEGIHKYPEAGTNPDLADVSFLQYPHRHMFHFTVEIDVTHNNRDLEFIQVKRYCQRLFNDIIDIDFMSCEMLCEQLIEQLSRKYPNRNIVVSCFEDDENGSTLTYEHQQ